MALCRITVANGMVGAWGWVGGELLHDNVVHVLDPNLVGAFLTGDDDRPLGALEAEAAGSPQVLELDTLLRNAGQRHPAMAAPLGEGMEVWAAGVTYESSKFARMAESAEGGDFYARVYAAERPELFFKATPSRTVGPNAEVRIRADSRWNVPEPELAVAVAANGRILGYTIGNDMSSRDIEGANPLYLPQAKVYRGSCALGPVIVPAETLGDPHALGIRLTITRGGATAFEGKTSTARMKRRVEELVQWLFRENDFPHGVILLTGTGIIPPDDFTLQPGDKIAIEIDRIGTLRNTVAALDDQKTL